METVENNKKVGAGIITMSVIYLVFQVFVLFGLLASLALKDQVTAILSESGTGAEFSATVIVIAIVTSLIFIASVILILMKKSIGAYLFIGIEVLSLIYNIVTGAFTIYSIFGLILPGLMIFFLYKKKELYFANLKF